MHPIIKAATRTAVLIAIGTAVLIAIRTAVIIATWTAVLIAIGTAVIIATRTAVLNVDTKKPPFTVANGGQGLRLFRAFNP